MSSEERRKILQMVEEGKITAEEAANLMRAIEDDVPDDGVHMEVIEAPKQTGYEKTHAPEFDAIKSRARRFALIPLWAGIVVTVFSAWAIYAIQQNAGMNFWFYCMTLPFLFGVLLIALGSGGRASRWIYINVDRKDAKPGDGPKHITFGLPIPFGFVSWFFETFRHNISGLDQHKADGIIAMMHATKNTKEPLMINVDDDDAHVQLYIG